MLILKSTQNVVFLIAFYGALMYFSIVFIGIILLVFYSIIKGLTLINADQCRSEERISHVDVGLVGHHHLLEIGTT